MTAMLIWQSNEAPTTEKPKKLLCSTVQGFSVEGLPDGKDNPRPQNNA